MDDFQISEIKQLVNLLNLEDGINSEEECDRESTVNTHPYSKRPADSVDDKQFFKREESRNHYAKYEKSKDIWSERDDKILDEDYDEAQLKEKPFYEMVYRQTLTPDDIFLQLGGKGPDSNSCECLLVKIKLEETNSKDEIALKISALSLICKTEKYYLDLDFPRRVDPGKCWAKWNQSNYLLIVQLYFDEDIQLQL